MYFLFDYIYVSLTHFIHDTCCRLVHICVFEVVEKAIIHTVLSVPTLHHHRRAV